MSKRTYNFTAFPLSWDVLCRKRASRKQKDAV
jgi:hypothetical protein